MNAISRSVQAQRGHIIHTQPWAQIVRCYAEWVAQGLPFAPMLNLVQAVAGSACASELFAATSMHDLLLSDRADFHTGDSMLHVSYLPARRQFHFEHRAFSGPADQRDCPESEALATLALFLRYKHGVLFSATAA